MAMNETKDLEQLRVNCSKHGQRLMECLKAYEVAQLGYKVQEQQFKDIYDKVLCENEFFSTMDYAKHGDEKDIIKAGERITDSTYDFLLSNEDWHRYMDMTKPYCIEAGLTDKDDHYVTDWLEIEIECRNELVDFIISSILPASMQDKFNNVKRNIVYQNKLIHIVKSVFVK